MAIREATLQPARESDSPRGAGTALNARIGTTAAILAAQFWGLTTTLAAWQAGNGAALGTSLVFQGACTIAALAVGRVRRS